MLESVRCREWSPLATQQLRCRALLQIVGYNISSYEHTDIQCSYYYTLHTTTMSAPIYTSEKLLSNHPKWREIDSELIHKMSSPSVVIRIWQHLHQDSVPNESGGHINDIMVQTWSVNFSGLLHIGANLALDFTPNSFKHNTLVFQMIGGYFCAYDSLKLENCKSLCPAEKDKRIASPAKQIPIDKRRLKAGSYVDPKSISPSKSNNRYSSHSQSPPSTMHLYRGSSPRSYVDEPEIQEYSGSAEGIQSSLSIKSSNASVQDMDIDESETAENFVHETETMPKCRYISMKFLKSEVRPSYTAQKLKDLHFLQYSIKIRFKSVRDIKNEIYEKSAMENLGNVSPQTLLDSDDFSRSENLSVSSREYSLLSGKNKRHQNLGEIISDFSFMESSSKIDNTRLEGLNEISREKGKSLPPNAINQMSEQIDTRFTIPLNKLLDYKSQPSPSHRLKFAQLTRAIEFGRFKKRLLQDEYDRARVTLRKKRETLTKLHEENQDIGTDLMTKFHALSKKSDQLRELKNSEAALCELCARSASLLYARRWELLQDIQFIFPIHNDDKGRICILGAHLPACKDNDDSLEQCGEAALAITLGRVAHATALAASILGTPLRYPLKLMGSRTKVLDHISSHNNNEIPLFARNKDSMMFRYGLFLLNTNIAQLLWAVHKHFTPDPRDTLNNLKKLITPPIVSPSFDASKMFGSSSSVETAGTGLVFKNYGLIHPGSAPILSGLPQSVPTSVTGVSSTPRLSRNPQSLRSLVAVGSGGSRQFNRFKNSVDGHSLNNSLISRKHRYSRSVGSYAEEQVLQDLEGSDPSIFLHESPTKTNDQDMVDSQLENKQNILSFSESDLTKVSDILSPETSSVNELSPKEEKVMFSLGDDPNNEPVIDENQHKTYMKDIAKQLSITESNIEESEDKCQNSIKDEGDSVSKKLPHSESFNSTSDESSLREECSSNCLEVVEATNQILENIHQLELDQQSLNKCPVAASQDIEKLDFPPHCMFPCAANCPKIGLDAKLHPGYDHCENGKEIMQDVIVLPSAEAVMTCSSHFSNTELMDIAEVFDITTSSLNENNDLQNQT